MHDLTSSDKIEILRKVAIFSEANNQLLQSLADAMEEVIALKGKKIIEKGTVGDAAFILVEGTVRVHDGNHVLARLGRGEMFGEYALIDRQTRSASITAEEQCLLLKLDQADFYRIATTNADILRGVLKVLINRMREMNELEEKLAKSYLKIQKQKEQIEKQNINIKIQKEQLEEQNFDLVKLNEEKNHFISVLIHGLKNPLTSSLCLADMMGEDTQGLEKSQQQSLEIISKSLRRINNLVNEILDVNAIDSKVFELKYQDLRLHEIITELVENYKYSIEQKGIVLKKGLEEIEVRLNRVYFTQIIDNLLSNAVKFTPSGRGIDLRLSRSDGQIVFTITDEGPGIEKKRIDNIFNEYKRQRVMDEQEAPAKGLGLAIVYKYVTAMDGTVTCESEPGKGVRFTVSFNQE
jgi:signal transduction histidine kinase